VNGSTPDEADRHGEDIALSNELLVPVVGKPLLQFRMGYGVHLELGHDFEVTIETPLTVTDGGSAWSGEPLTAEAAGALLPLNLRDVSFVRVDRDGTLNLGLGEATLSMPPHPMYEAWEVRGPDNMLIVCPPGGKYVAVWKPEGES
jgi:hypothetical protein